MLATIKAVMMIERKAMLPNALFGEFNKGITEREKLRVKLFFSLFTDLKLTQS
jgi:hypothetical protein